MTRGSRGGAARLATAVLAGVLLAALATGCDGPDGAGGEHVAPGAGRRLEEQRTDVRALVVELVQVTAAALDGRLRTARGRWDGCESAFPEGHRSFRYDADARVDTPVGARAAPGPLDALRPALEQHGFDIGEPVPGPGGGRSLPVSRDGLTGTVSVVPLAAERGDGPGDRRGDAPSVLLAVAGPCIEVPEDERGEWARRREESPSLR